MDISPFAVEWSRKRGLDVFQGELRPGNLPPASVDVLTMIEVIEHLPAPREVFATLQEILRPGGLVLIQTANFAGRQAVSGGADYHYYLPGHLHYYSTITMRRFLNEFGFTDVTFFRPVDFGLLPKLQKSRGDFKSARDYLRWARISWYHLKGKIALGDFALTSSMVALARRAS